MAKESGGGGSPWGAIINGIFGTVNKGQDYELQEAQLQYAALMRPGAYQPPMSSANRDTVVFIVLVLLLVLVIWLLK